MIFVSNIQGREDGKTGAVNRMGLLGDSPHLGIDIFRKFEDVLRIGAAKIVTLVKNFDADAAAVHIGNRWLFCCSSIVCSIARLSLRRALPPCDQSGPASSLPENELPLALCG